jgi:hypothetical protein
MSGGLQILSSFELAVGLACLKEPVKATERIENQRVSFTFETALSDCCPA